jgi:hypothetical protein
LSDVRPITQNFQRPSYRPQEAAGLDPEMRRMVVTAGGVGAALAILIGALSFSGHMRHTGVPVITAPDGPVRIKPENPGGEQFAGAEDMSAVDGERLAPAAEKPAIRALRAKRVHPAETHETVTAPVKPQTPPALVKPQIPAILAAPVPPPPANAPPAQGSAAIQLAAFASQQAAEQDWGKLAEKMPALFNGHKPVVVQAHLANRVVYRLRTGGFPDIAAARSFCDEVRTKGGDCSLAAF